VAAAEGRRFYAGTGAIRAELVSQTTAELVASVPPGDSSLKSIHRIDFRARAIPIQ